MQHIIKTSGNRAIEVKAMANDQLVLLAVCERDNKGYMIKIEVLELLDFDTCQKLIFALTETAQRIKAAA